MLFCPLGGTNLRILYYASVREGLALITILSARGYEPEGRHYASVREGPPGCRHPGKNT